jgi:hypothetical protein
MNLSERNKVYASAVNRFGAKAQLIKCLEEMAELSVEVAKIANGLNQGLFDGLIDEMADASILMEQVQLIYGIGTLVDVRKTTKVEKLKAIISGEIKHPHTQNPEISKPSQTQEGL